MHYHAWLFFFRYTISGVSYLGLKTFRADFLLTKPSPPPCYYCYGRKTVLKYLLISVKATDLGLYIPHLWLEKSPPRCGADILSLCSCILAQQEFSLDHTVQNSPAWWPLLWRDLLLPFMVQRKTATILAFPCTAAFKDSNKKQV